MSDAMYFQSGSPKTVVVLSTSTRSRKKVK